MRDDGGLLGVAPKAHVALPVEFEVQLLQLKASSPGYPWRIAECLGEGGMVPGNLAPENRS